MKDRPHLPRDSRQAAEELCLEREAERSRDHHRREALGAVEDPARDAVQRADRRAEVGATKLPRSCRAKVDAPRPGDPVGERDRREDVCERDGERIDHAGSVRNEDVAYVLEQRGERLRGETDAG